MRWVRLFFITFILVLQQYVGIPIASAASSAVVISQLQTGGPGTGTAGQEFIELYNMSTREVDVTGWCVAYSSASDASQSTVACLNAADVQTKLFLKAKSYVTFVSPDFTTATGYRGDGTFSYIGGMASTAGHVRVFDASKTEIDKVAWGTTATHPEGAASAVPSGGKSLNRITTTSGGLQDTDNNATDFSVVTPTIHSSGLYEVVTIIDVCPNIVGAQAAVPSGMVISNGQCIVPPPIHVCPNIIGAQSLVPTGYLLDDSGACQFDQCANISGLQIMVPVTYTSLSDGTCVQVDECLNIVGLQLAIPDGYKRSGTNECALDLVPLKITELLPNVSGSDTGNEFIELYNPTDAIVDMSRYAVYLGDSSSKLYKFPVNTLLQPRSYVVMSDTDMKFSLPNTTSRLTLVGVDGTFVDRTDVYASPRENESWALVDATWQYTNQPTPKAENAPSLIVDELEEMQKTSTTAISNCAPGKYRNPLTNRCRNIESDVSVLATCDADQYRNPDTGRCRKIAVVAAAAACRDDQYRSEETGRCRKIETASSATPCKEGQERNPDTNRCRNAAVKSVPAAAFSVKPVKDSVHAFVGWWALGGIAIIAIAYAGWEWRHEVMNVIRKLPGISR